MDMIPPALSPAQRPDAHRPSPDETRRQILAVVSLGATLRDAARYAGISRRQLAALRRADPDLTRLIRQRIARLKLHHLQRLADDPHWRSSAFLLERRWPNQFAPQRRAVPVDLRDTPPVIHIRRVRLPSDPPSDSTSAD